MNDYKVTLILEGDPAEKGDVRLETFIGGVSVNSLQTTSIHSTYHAASPAHKEG